MPFSSILIAVAVMGGLGILLAVVLAVAHRAFYVYEDPRIDAVEEMLPRTNCGACGTAGCRAFAEAVIEGKLTPAACTVCMPEDREAIAAYLGVEVGEVDRKVARLACAGGNHVAWFRGRYHGPPTCRAAAAAGGGTKGCAWGCMGLGDCERICDFDAISLDAQGLPVVDLDKCNACGDCIDICPKGLYSLQPISHQLFVACKNLAKEEAALAQCEVACTACGRCAADAPEGLIRITDNLSRIDYRKNDLASRVAIERCPTGAIVWLDPELGAIRGKEAKQIKRHQSLPVRQQEK